MKRIFIIALGCIVFPLVLNAQDYCKALLKDAQKALENAELGKAKSNLESCLWCDADNELLAEKIKLVISIIDQYAKISQSPNYQVDTSKVEMIDLWPIDPIDPLFVDPLLELSPSQRVYRNEMIYLTRKLCRVAETVSDNRLKRLFALQGLNHYRLIIGGDQETRWMLLELLLQELKREQISKYNRGGSGATSGDYRMAIPGERGEFWMYSEKGFMRKGNFSDLAFYDKGAVSMGPVVQNDLMTGQKMVVDNEGKYYAILSGQNEIEVFELKLNSGNHPFRLANRLPTPFRIFIEPGIQSMRFSPSGDALIIDFVNGRVQQWDFLEESIPLTLDFEESVSQVFLHPSSGRILAQLENGRLGYQKINGQVEWIDEVSSEHISALACSQYGGDDFLALGTRSGKIILMKMAYQSDGLDFIPFRVIVAGNSAITALRFSPPGQDILGIGPRYLVSVGEGKKVQMWDLSQNDVYREPIRFADAPGRITDLKFTNSQSSILAITDKARLWPICIDLDILGWQLCQYKDKDLTLAEWQKHIGPGYSFRLPSCQSVEFK